MKIKSWVSVGCLSGTIFIMGCATGGGGKPVQVELPAGDQLHIVEMTPAAGGQLIHGERVNVKVAYRLESSEEGRILTRPFKGGRQSQGYMAHAPVSCVPGSGHAETWFTFRQDAVTDEIRVTLVDQKARKLIRVVTNAYPASWSAAPTE